MSNIGLLHYNNYFNRIIKVEGNKWSNYTSVDVNRTYLTGINFNPNDGITTTLVLGNGAAPASVNAKLDSYDYLIVCDDSGNIESRWFIMDGSRTRSNQFEISLRRDVIADHLDKVKSAPTFIEKGIISDTTNPLLYNSEAMTYNQIKQNETLLKDSTGCGWVVGYIPQDAMTDTSHFINKDVILHSTADISIAGIANWDYYNACSLYTSPEVWASSSLTKQVLLKAKEHYPEYNYGSYIHWAEQKVKGIITVPQGGSVSSALDSSAISYDSWSGVVVNRTTGTQNPPTTFQGGYLANNMPSDSTLWTYLDAVLSEQGIGGSVVIKQASVINSMVALNGKTIYDSTADAYYKINVKNVNAQGTTGLSETSSVVDTFMNRLNDDIVRTQSGTGSATIANTVGNFNKSDVTVGYNGNGYTIELTQLFTYASVEIDGNRNHVVDAPYDMFCIPYSDTKSIQVDSSTTVLCNKELAISIAQEIAHDAGSGSVFDTQLLPYCPCQELINQNPNITADNATIDLRGLSIDLIRDTTNSFTQVTVTAITWNSVVAQYGQLYDENYRPIYYYAASNNTYYYRNPAVGNVLGAIIWCTSATRSFDIDESISASSNALDRKVENECDMYRLCSGNYQGVFEFNAAKSFGVSGFRVDCTFKPYNPYIHVVPKLGGLYGNFAEYKDARGLICGGDFSLAQLSDTWANYELQNKNYQNIFDRQIQNMDFNNKLNMMEAGVQAMTGTVSAGVSGAMTGAMIPGAGAAGAIFGGVVGAATGLAGGITDLSILGRKQEEAKDYAIDMYGYQLGNIKAIPTSLAKNTALTANTKIFPFIEKYSCTDIEKQALRDKITYNGMTIMKIGTINDLTGFVKGQIIRLNELNEDNHMANAIYEEINKGVYI